VVPTCKRILKNVKVQYREKHMHSKKHELSVKEKDNYHITRKVVRKDVCAEF